MAENVDSVATKISELLSTLSDDDVLIDHQDTKCTKERQIKTHEKDRPLHFEGEMAARGSARHRLPACPGPWPTTTTRSSPLLPLLD